MFIQVITAKVRDREGLDRQIARWDEEIRPGAVGFLGSTSGITDDGKLVVVARFESEEAALRNSDRPEQSAWWAETESMLEDPEFKNSVDVVTMGGGGSDDAGFVQVMRGRILDRAKMDEIRTKMEAVESAFAAHRPDVIGDVTAVHDDGTYTDTVYFTSEAEARENEAKEMPPEMKEMFDEFLQASSIDEYLDLKNPRML